MYHLAPRYFIALNTLFCLQYSETVDGFRFQTSAAVFVLMYIFPSSSINCGYFILQAPFCTLYFAFTFADKITLPLIGYTPLLLCQWESLAAEIDPHSGANTAVAVVDTVATADDAAVAVDIGGKVLKEAG